MSGHDEAYIEKFQPREPKPEPDAYVLASPWERELKPKPNAYIIHADHTSEMKHFHTDASIRRYCISKRAWCGWRLVEDTAHWANGHYVCVYPQDMRERGYVRRATPSLGGEE